MDYKLVTREEMRDAVNYVFFYHPIINYWSKILGVEDYTIKTNQIEPEQVTFPDDIEEKDRYFIGISVENKEATITHDRPLTEEDILHELLHLAYPDKSEDWVNAQTSIKLKEKKDELN